jgi:proline iminopeptidase
LTHLNADSLLSLTQENASATITGFHIPFASLNAINEYFVDCQDAQLFCRTIGKGNPLIVIHGGPGLTQDYLLPQMQKLARDNFVIFYDQRGCGQSTGEVNVNTITIENFVNDIEKIRQSFGYDKVSILGHSWGGFLAMQYALTYPKQVDKLILANSMPASSEELSLFFNEWIYRMAPYKEELNVIYQSKDFQEGNKEIVEHLYRLIFQTYCYNPEKAKHLNLRMPATASIKGSQVNAILQDNLLGKSFDLHQALRNLTHRTLVIHGDSDPIPALTAQHIHENIKGSKYILMKECGHFPYVEDPDLFFNHLEFFLQTEITGLK